MQLDEDRAATFRSACMRLSYLALDRPEMQFTAKECARGMSNPTERHWQLLKRATRFLVTAPRIIWSWKRQRWPSKVTGFSDTDWAGCPVTRRSTSCMIFKLGSHTVLTASTTQVPIALSSGEAEFYGTVKTASRLIGVGGLLTDFGFAVNLELLTDSSAAQGVLARRGTGKIRHLETQTLWIQKAVQDKVIVAGRVPGNLNPADLGTKFLAEANILRLLHGIGLRIEVSRDKRALRAMAA